MTALELCSLTPALSQWEREKIAKFPHPEGEGKIKSASMTAHSKSEISAAGFVAAIAIEFDCVAGSFTRRAAVLAVFGRWTRTRRVLTSVFVSHYFSPKNLLMILVGTVAELNTSTEPNRTDLASQLKECAEVLAQE